MTGREWLEQASWLEIAGLVSISLLIFLVLLLTPFNWMLDKAIDWVAEKITPEPGE